MPMGKFQEDLCLRESVPLMRKMMLLFEERMAAPDHRLRMCQAPGRLRGMVSREEL